jgi:hypothetical protein
LLPVCLAFSGNLNHRFTLAKSGDNQIETGAREFVRQEK